jgi:hypothetical protein
VQQAITTLIRTLSGQIGLSKSRLETFCFLVIGMTSARTVNLTHIASERQTAAKTASTYRRLQRFFQHAILPPDWSARLVISLLGVAGSWYLCLDRTNWKIGRRHVNILMLAVVTQRHRVPLMWTVLDKAGTSSTAERIALMQRYLAMFGVDSVKLLLADREFIGGDWLHFLHKNNVPFAIRMKANLRVRSEDGRELVLSMHLRKLRGTQQFSGCLAGDTSDQPIRLNFAAKRVKGGDLLIVATNAATSGRKGLSAYRKRWAIECLFGDTKTRGLNLEDTRLTDPRKLDLLLGAVALAIVWASKAATQLVGRGKRRRKSHGYFAKSWFRIGFDYLRHLMRNHPLAAIKPWLAMQRTKSRVV